MAADDLVVYELHVGTFTPEGTFEAITSRLAVLVELGVTAIELMPVVQFPGERNWGYDAVHPFAVQNSYGGPVALQRLVDAAHRAGLAVLIDVVYNHFGPEGAYFAKFGHYFTDCYRTPWGNAINYDGPDSDPVRQFVIDNARMWIRDFHADGLRLDAVHAIYDRSPYHILAEIEQAAQEEAARQERLVHIIAETHQNDVRHIRPIAEGGYGLDGVWSDDFHHAVHAFFTGERDGYYADFGLPEQIAKAYHDVFVYDGCYSPFFRRRQGSRVGTTERTRFVVCVQNHDQVGNRAASDRHSTLLPAAAQRLACGLLMLSPCVPLLFMGEEYGEQRPFPFFCSFGDAELIEAVRKGRREEFAELAFQWKGELADPQSPETFQAAKLSWSWPEGSPQAARRRLYQDLLTARRQWPGLRDRKHTVARIVDQRGTEYHDGETPLLLLERGGDDGLLAVANLSSNAVALGELAPANDTLRLSTEDSRYGGRRTVESMTGGDSARRCNLIQILPFELLIFDRSGGRL